MAGSRAWQRIFDSNTRFANNDRDFFLLNMHLEPSTRRSPEPIACLRYRKLQGVPREPGDVDTLLALQSHLARQRTTTHDQVIALTRTAVLIEPSVTGDIFTVPVYDSDDEAFVKRKMEQLHHLYVLV